MKLVLSNDITAGELAGTLRQVLKSLADIVTVKPLHFSAELLTLSKSLSAEIDGMKGLPSVPFIAGLRVFINRLASVLNSPDASSLLVEYIILHYVRQVYLLGAPEDDAFIAFDSAPVLSERALSALRDFAEPEKKSFTLDSIFKKIGKVKNPVIRALLDRNVPFLLLRCEDANAEIAFLAKSAIAYFMRQNDLLPDDVEASDAVFSEIFGLVDDLLILKSTRHIILRKAESAVLSEHLNNAIKFDSLFGDLVFKLDENHIWLSEVDKALLYQYFESAINSRCMDTKALLLNPREADSFFVLVIFFQFLGKAIDTYGNHRADYQSLDLTKLTEKIETGELLYWDKGTDRLYRYSGLTATKLLDFVNVADANDHKNFQGVQIFNRWRQNGLLISSAVFERNGVVNQIQADFFRVVTAKIVSKLYDSKLPEFRLEDLVMEPVLLLGQKFSSGFLRHFSVNTITFDTLLNPRPIALNGRTISHLGSDRRALGYTMIEWSTDPNLLTADAYSGRNAFVRIRNSITFSQCWFEADRMRAIPLYLMDSATLLTANALEIDARHVPEIPGDWFPPSLRELLFSRGLNAQIITYTSEFETLISGLISEKSIRPELKRSLGLLASRVHQSDSISMQALIALMVECRGEVPSDLDRMIAMHAQNILNLLTEKLLEHKKVGPVLISALQRDHNALNEAISRIDSHAAEITSEKRLRSYSGEARTVLILGASISNKMFTALFNDAFDNIIFIIPEFARARVANQLDFLLKYKSVQLDNIARFRGQFRKIGEDATNSEDVSALIPQVAKSTSVASLPRSETQNDLEAAYKVQFDDGTIRYISREAKYEVLHDLEESDSEIGNSDDNSRIAGKDLQVGNTIVLSSGGGSDIIRNLLHRDPVVAALFERAQFWRRPIQNEPDLATVIKKMRQIGVQREPQTLRLWWHQHYTRIRPQGSDAEIEKIMKFYGEKSQQRIQDCQSAASRYTALRVTLGKKLKEMLRADLIWGKRPTNETILRMLRGIDDDLFKSMDLKIAEQIRLDYSRLEVLTIVAKSADVHQIPCERLEQEI